MRRELIEPSSGSGGGGKGEGVLLDWTCRVIDQSLILLKQLSVILPANTSSLAFRPLTLLKRNILGFVLAA